MEFQPPLTPLRIPQDFTNRKVMETMAKIANGENRNYNDLLTGLRIRTMANKRQRAEEMEPNRFKQAQSMVTHAGAPMNNTPQNVNSFNDQRMTLDPNQGPSYPYMDSGLNANDPRARAPIPNENTGMPQFMTVGRGFNQNAYGSDSDARSASTESNGWLVLRRAG